MLSKTLSPRQMQLLCVSLILALALGGAWQAFAWGRTQLDTGALVCADTLRLHIRAESDSIASQSAKLHVRDAVLAYLDTAYAPTCVFGSFERMPVSIATPIKYSSQLM